MEFFLCTVSTKISNENLCNTLLVSTVLGRNKEETGVCTPEQHLFGPRLSRACPTFHSCVNESSEGLEVLLIEMTGSCSLQLHKEPHRIYGGGGGGGG